MHYPDVSCCMPTYGRPVELLNESVYSFLEQDYPGNKELVIYNDNSQINFTINHPEIRMINSKIREPDLGSKYNKTVDYSKYNQILLWDDDDICLRHRIRYSIESMIDDVFIAEKYYIYYVARNRIEIIQNHVPATLCINKDIWYEQGGYDPKDRGADLKMAMFAKNMMKRAAGMSNDDIFYIYKWEPSARYHHSAVTRNNTDEQARELIDKKIPEAIKGDFVIQPQHYTNYNDLINSLTSN